VTAISTTNFPNGVTNAPLNSVLQTYGAVDPTVFHAFFNDFDVFTAGDWTGTATGSVTNAVAAGDGGLLSMANSAANNDLDSIQLKAASFQIVSGQQAWIKARFKLSNATNAALTLGIIQTTTTPLTVTDGLYFSKAAASTTLTAKVAKSSTASSVNVGTMADDTFVVVGLHYNPNVDAITVYLNGNRVGQLPTTNLPTGVNLNVTLAVANGTAAANTLTTDYILVATERPSTQNN
jgi:hypothetical protein